jgi:predicted dehydrogenase
VIKAAVIGVGSMGANHARVYTELDSVQLVAVSDSNADRLQFIAEKYKVSVYTDYRDLLVKEKPDVVSIVVPTKDHVAVALDCVRAGAHLLIEKPIASTVGEAQIIINAARIANCKLMVGHIVRFNPAVMEMKKRLDADELGRIFQIVCRREGPFPARIRDVGVVVDLAPHDIDIIRYLSGSDLIRLYAETEKRIHTEHEDLMIAIMRLQNGITAALNINWLTPAKIREITVVGEKGMFKVDDLTQDLYFYENSLAVQEIWDSLKTISGVNPGKMIRFAIDRVEPLKKEIFSFVQAIENDSIMPVSGEDGLQALRIASALVESGLSHQVIEL